jgi:hypothetical protein
VAGDGCHRGDVDRLVVNMLRQEFMAYGEGQAFQAHRAVCLAVKARLSWLAGECERQVARRCGDEAGHAVWRQAIEAGRLAEAARRHECPAAMSAGAIAGLPAGMAASARIRGYERTATVTRLRCRRAEVPGQITAGQQRQALLYASEVSPCAMAASS